MGARICNHFHNRGDGRADDSALAASQPTQLRHLPRADTLATTESLEWLNQLVAKLWPRVDKAVQKIVEEKVAPRLQESMPTGLKRIYFKKFTLGERTPTFGPIKVYDAHHQGVKLILGVDYQSDVSIEISTNVGNIGIKEVQLRGELVMWLAPLIDEVPVVGGAAISFVDPPELSLDFTGIGNIADLPGIAGSLRNAINSAIASFLVLPNVIAIPIGTEEQGVDHALLKRPVPYGVLRVTALHAMDLFGSDWNLVSKATSDPYVQVSIADDCWRSSTVLKNCDPQWKDDDFHDFLIYSREQKVLIKVYDEDKIKYDDLIGIVESPLMIVEALSQSAVPILLSDPKHPNRGCGNICLKFEWFEPMPKELGDFGCIMMIKVKRVLLPIVLGSEVAVQAQLGSVVKTTPVQHVLSSTSAPATVGSLLADVARRCNKEGLDRESIARITGLRCEEISHFLLPSTSGPSNSSACPPKEGLTLTDSHAESSTTLELLVETALYFPLATTGQLDSGILSLVLVDRKCKTLQGSPAVNIQLATLRDAPGLLLAGPVCFVCGEGGGMKVAAEIDVRAFGLKPATFARASVASSKRQLGMSSGSSTSATHRP